MNTNNQINKEKDIHERIFHFVVRVLKLLSKLPKNRINLIITDQCGRSVSSVGANDQEADACVSRRDFLAKYGITKKELKETCFWLRLLEELNPNFEVDEIAYLRKEGQEILLIVSSIIRNTRKNNT